MESKTTLPANLNNIPKFKSDTSKWVYFFANLTEEVWVPLKDCFEAAYRRQLKFQLTQYGVAFAAGKKNQRLPLFTY